ncbi:MAG: hypothetical protein HRS51_01270 [Candidatus Nitrosopelagicus sp.]|nr:hypothetical protein [Candidatus Nitrosopelagicus sp.]
MSDTKKFQVGSSTGLDSFYWGSVEESQFLTTFRGQLTDVKLKAIYKQLPKPKPKKKSAGRLPNSGESK